MRNRTRKCTRRIDPERSKEEPHLSGAYIRTLVKQLTTSSRPLKHEAEASTKFSPAAKCNEAIDDAQQPQVKKKVRRRSHTSKPYQQRLLNMAEARREIVAALKFHRAAMRQAETEAIAREFQDNSQVCPSANFNFPPLGVAPSSSSSSSCSSLFPWVPSVDSGLNINLLSENPSINLNFHQQGIPDPCFFMNNGIDNNDLMTSQILSSLPSPSIFGHKNPIEIAPPLSSIPVSGLSALNPPYTNNSLAKPPDFNQPIVSPSSTAVDDEEIMAEIRSLGEQHETQLSGTTDLVNSAWWFRFLNSLDAKDDGIQGKMDGLFDEFMEIPSWFKDGRGNQGANPVASSSDDYEDFLQDNSFE
ncbi:hypothetical protein EJ110_NYTH00371 [Nymphaea thermarum]|nr:hypothetical protein EJ110_NYTH00371 [Nymphaea thermarum]